MSFARIKTFPIDRTVGLICGFHLLNSFLFKVIWPGVLLLNLARNNVCLFSVFDLTFIVVCVTHLKICCCDSCLHMKGVTFPFFISVYSGKGAYTYR